MAEVIHRAETTICIETNLDKYITSVAWMQGETRAEFAKRVFVRVMEVMNDASPEA